MPNERSRGVTSTPAPTTTTAPAPIRSTDQAEGSAAGAYAAGLRRRRAASWRCPPLECGRRDPLDLDPRPGVRGREAVAAVRAERRAAESWLLAVEHLAELGHDCRFAVPEHLAEHWVAAS